MSPAAPARPAPRLPARPEHPAAALLADELPAPLVPGPRDRRLVAVLAWHDEVLEVRDVDTWRPFTVGVQSGSLRVASAPFPRPVPLLQPVPGGSFRVLVPPGVRASLKTEGGETPIDALLHGGRATVVEVPFRGASLLLGLHERMTWELGGLRLVVRHVRAHPRERMPWLSHVDAAFTSTLVMVLLAAIVAVRMFLLDEGGFTLHEDALAKRPVSWNTHVRPPPPPKEPLARGGAPRPEGAAGKRDAPARQVAPPRPGGVDAAKRARDIATVRQTGLLELLQRAGPVSELFGAGGPTSGINAALNALHAGTQPGDSQGVEGLGSRGPHDGGGGNTFGPGGTGPGGWGTDPRGRPSLELFDAPRVPGAPRTPPVRPQVQGCEHAREVVGRAIRMRHSQIRYCYERELQKDPNLRGKITLGFELTPTGDVATSDIRESTMGSEPVETCLRNAVRTWRIPLPAGCGQVQVSYPFVFERAQ